jgi:hypothetical protein
MQEIRTRMKKKMAAQGLWTDERQPRRTVGSSGDKAGVVLLNVYENVYEDGAVLVNGPAGFGTWRQYNG